MKKIIGSAMLLGAFLASESALAWGLTGHRVVSQIAEQHISKKTRKKITKIIGPQKLAYWANWPDFIKSDDSWKHADSYHYVNIPGDLDRAQFDVALDGTSDDNMYKKGLFLINELKNNKNLTIEQKQHDLYFLIHILGDAHQPLHVGRPDDLGGNRIKVEWFRDKVNIHTVWDSKLVDYENYSYTEYSNLLDIATKEQQKTMQEGTFADWIYGSYIIANRIYAGVKMDDKLGYRYHFDNKKTIEDQMLKGGLRLAKVLDEIYK
ncbi:MULTISPECIES: S1/P1 nuclease [unclassified Empedobacter]|uniref:S1/P1 nuclease n=1 Tax=unclassified Empedobacter TaxID=2643773 RepID=UPI0025B94D84|nr:MULTISPECIES: S1/P1 nuclease [unclassified Empedobacter]